MNLLIPSKCLVKYFFLLEDIECLNLYRRTCLGRTVSFYIHDNGTMRVPYWLPCVLSIIIQDLDLIIFVSSIVIFLRTYIAIAYVFYCTFRFFYLTSLPSLSVPISLSFSLIIYLKLCDCVELLPLCLLLVLFQIVCYYVQCFTPFAFLFLPNYIGCALTFAFFYHLCAGKCTTRCFRYVLSSFTLSWHYTACCQFHWFLPFLIGYILLQCFCFVAPYSARCTHLFFYVCIFNSQIRSDSILYLCLSLIHYTCVPATVNIWVKVTFLCFVSLLFLGVMYIHLLRGSGHWLNYFACFFHAIFALLYGREQTWTCWLCT